MATRGTSTKAMLGRRRAGDPAVALDAMARAEARLAMATKTGHGRTGVSMKARVFVALKTTVLDPRGHALP